MSEHYTRATEAWKEADRRALECEMLVSAARYAFLQGKGAGPSEIQVAEARMLRKLADLKLRDAMDTVGRARSGSPTKGGS